MKLRTTALAVALVAAAVPSLTTSADADPWGWRGGRGWGGFGYYPRYSAFAYGYAPAYEYAPGIAYRYSPRLRAPYSPSVYRAFVWEQPHWYEFHRRYVRYGY